MRFIQKLGLALGLGAAIASSAGLAQQAQFISILTGGTSGVYHPLGVSLSQIYGKVIPGVRSSVQATKASAENLNLLQAGRGEIAFTLGDALSDAWKGNEEVGFKVPLKKLRGVAGIYSNYIQIVASADSGIKTLADLKGKRVAVDAPKSGTEINARAYLAGTIPANTYEGQTVSVTTVAIENFIVTHEGVPTDTVYKMTKATYENLDQMVAAHTAEKAIKREEVPMHMPLPLHPGAEKYYREVCLIK